MTEKTAPKSFDQKIEKVRQEWQENPTVERAAMLSTLYQGYSSRFLSDNARIWTTAATMIPLSLGSFVVLASIERPSRFQVVLLPLTGWLLMSIWLVIAENHRAFQEASEKWLIALEQVWGFDKEERPKKRSSWLTRSQRVKQMRFALWWLVTVGAAVIILFWPQGLLG
jgi:hypothetical protein